MQDAQTYLEVIRSRGERRLELERVYHNLQNQELFLRAYAKLYANEGANTPGVNPHDTVDGMSLERIEGILKSLHDGKYQWTPVRRTYRLKKNGKLRPLGLPGWNDKMLQEVIRTILSAYYEPQFSEASHGFRQGRGCHTALQSVLFNWKGTKWFIEGDIKGCFDNIDHDKLLEIVGRSIKDERFLKLLRGMLDAGYMEDWKYHSTYSGTPQGGVLSPLLANIFLNELDTYIERELIPQYNKGDQRRINPKYNQTTKAIWKARRTGDIEQYETLKKEQRTLPFGDTQDPNYRRLKYVRYADDFIIGFVGPYTEAEEIKQGIREFLATIGLTMSEEKTLITNATKESARFLGYEIRMAHSDTRMCNKRRSINGTPIFRVPDDVAQEWRNRYTSGGKPTHRTELINNSDYDIVTTFNTEFQGLVNYYGMAHDVAAKLYPVKWAYLQTLVKTLAVKHKQKPTWVYRNFQRKLENGITAIVVEVPREGKKPLVAKFGGTPIRFDKKAVITESKPKLIISRNELVRRLTAQECEICGSTGGIQVHHIRKLKDVQARYQGRPNPPKWVVRMIELRRKSMVVCATCHQEIHTGAYDGPKLT